MERRSCHVGYPESHARAGVALLAVPGSRSRAAESLRLDCGRFPSVPPGFLPSTEPLQRLPQPEYQAWEALVDAIPALLAAGQARKPVEELPVIPVGECAVSWSRGDGRAGPLVQQPRAGGGYPLEPTAGIP